MTEFTHSEMMLIIQGLRLVNGIDRRGYEYKPSPEDRAAAMTLLERIDAPEFDHQEADDNMPGIVSSARMLTPYESIKIPGTKVLLMRGGQWEGPFIVQSGEGRTPEHLILLNPRGNVLFEEHVDEYSVGYQIRAI